MARLRKFVAYRSLERPYTRISKYNKKAYIKSRPHMVLVKFNMGDLKKKFPVKLLLKTKSDLQIRQNALESARQTSNRVLEKALGKTGYNMSVVVYPHHVLRENPLASGAGADRMSTGMSQAFGKTIGVAARLRKGEPVFSVGVEKQHIETAKKALHRAATKLPCSCIIEVIAA